MWELRLISLVPTKMAIKLHHVKQMGISFYTTGDTEFEVHNIKIRISFTHQELDG